MLASMLSRCPSPKAVASPKCRLVFAAAVAAFVFAAATVVLVGHPDGRAFDVGAATQQVSEGEAAAPIWSYSRWPAFELPQEMPVGHCLGVDEHARTVEVLLQMTRLWRASPQRDCRRTVAIFDRLFNVRETVGALNVTTRVLETKIRNWLGNNDEYYARVSQQKITAVTNRYTYEATLFNPLRSKRPIVAGSNVRERDYVDDLAAAARKDCDFCSYKENTAEDVFGRLESRYAYTAANAFKYDAWHSMVIFKSHHPLAWTKDDFLDVFELANQWIRTVAQRDEQLLYPLMLWDLLPHSGASQVHPHTHVSVSANAYYGIPEGWRAAADRYHRDVGRNYFTDLIAVHDNLGLAVFRGQAVALAHLTPKKESEVVIVGHEVDSDFMNLLYSTLRAFIDDMEHACFSLSVVYPPLKPDTPGHVPAFARLVTRGAAFDVRSDISSMDHRISTRIHSSSLILSGSQWICELAKCNRLAAPPLLSLSGEM